ncbi:hypothetical protein KPL71_024990 [Citrus sinensis]|uniref:Uncharacterized protein n=1 Tax=Citrus sinensis TaxID=2711 RepID=A0ACB8IWD8_CITSI|nr:hypothetical protein KPL71_024990 [Citrus sinensis]
MEITDDKWNEIDGNAISDLHLALADGVLSSVAEKNTAKEIWDTLTKLYEAKSLHNKIFLKRKLYTFRMAESTMVTDHINTLKTLFSQLTTLGHNIEENERAELLLQSLPDSYDQLIINLTNNNPSDSLIFDDVSASVLNEESKRKNKENRQASSQQAEALSVTRGRSTERGPSGSHNNGRSKSRSKKNVKYYNCDKKGHVKKECWSNQKRGEGKEPESSNAQGCVARATWHMTSRREWFHTYEHISGGSVYMGDDHALEIAGIGTIKIKIFDGTIRTIGEVRHVNGLKKNLLSLGQMDNHGYKNHVENGIMKIVKGALVLMKAEKIGANLFMLKGETLQEADACVASNGEESTMMWHLKLGHMSEQGLKILSERKLLPRLKSVSLPFCEHCVTSKQHRLKFSRSIARSKCILDLIHSDVWESPDISMGGAKYMVTFIDDYSRRCWVYPIKKKSDVFPVFKEYKVRVELESGKKIKCLRTDNGGEYTDGEFLAFCKQEGIQRQFTVAYTPQQNGVAERMNRTLTEWIRAMLRTAGLPNSFWAEAAKTACYIVNRSPSTAIGLKTAMEMWTGKPTDYSYLHAFGCPVYVMYNAQERTKLDPKSRRCIFLGYADGVKGYHLWDPTAHKIVINRDVIFIEDQLQMRDEDDSRVKEKSETIPIYVENNPEYSDSSEAEPEHEEQEPVESESSEVHRSTRERRPPTWHSEYVTEINVAYCLLTEDEEPSTFHEALNSSDVALWMTAMQEEIKALHKNKTWELVPLPHGRKAIGNKWVYKIKRDGNDQVELYRARLVVKGYAQKEGIDFNEIFSPVVRLTTVRVVLAMCASFDLHLEQLHVKTAFLHGELEEEIYMLQPEGFAKTGKKNLVCRLNKSLYRLKQAPRCWYKRFDSFIMSLGYNRLSSDHCAYYKRPNKDRVQELKAQLARAFEMKDLGPANKILGMQIHRDRNNKKIWLSQKNYLKKILRCFNMQDFSRYMANPGGEHWIAVKRILRYIRGTSDVALCYEGSEFTVRGYVDSDFAGDLDKRKFTTGYVFTLAGAAVSWVSKLQTVVALSTTEAEYMAATQVCKEAIWIQWLLEELGHKQQKIHVFCDSQSALHIARNPAFHSKTKHIGVQYHFVREVVEDGNVDLQKIHTKENLADVLTKPINTDNRHPTFYEYSSYPPFLGDDRPSWVSNYRIVGKRGMSCSPQRFGAWRNCRDFVRLCPLSLGDEYLVGTYLWSVLVSSWHMPVHDVLPGLCSCHSAEEICLRVRDEDMAELTSVCWAFSPSRQRYQCRSIPDFAMSNRRGKLIVDESDEEVEDSYHNLLGPIDPLYHSRSVGPFYNRDTPEYPHPKTIFPSLDFEPMGNRGGPSSGSGENHSSEGAGVPDEEGDVLLVIPGKGDVPSQPPKGYVTMHLESFKLGARLPLQPYFARILGGMHLAPGQLHPNGWRVLSALYVLWEMCGLGELSLMEVKYLYQLRSSPKEAGWYYFMSNSAKRKPITDFPSSCKNWKNKFFFTGENWCPTIHLVGGDIHLLTRFVTLESWGLIKKLDDDPLLNVEIALVNASTCQDLLSSTNLIRSRLCQRNVLGGQNSGEKVCDKSPEVSAQSGDRSSHLPPRDHGNYLTPYQRDYGKSVGPKMIKDIESMNLCELIGSIQRDSFKLATLVSCYKNKSTRHERRLQADNQDLKKKAEFVERSREKLLDLHKQIMDLEEKVTIAESNSSKLESELGDLKSDLQAAQSERDTLKTTYEEQIKSLNEQVAELKSKSAEVDDRLDAENNSGLAFCYKCIMFVLKEEYPELNMSKLEARVQKYMAESD